MRKTSEEAWEILNILADDSRQITLKKGENAPLGESIFNKELAALKEEIHHLKEKAYSPQVPKCEVFHVNMHNTLSCSSRLEIVQSVVGIPHQVLDTPPQMPITSIPKPMEDMMKLFMQTSINLNESLTKVSQGILQEKE